LLSIVALIGFVACRGMLSRLSQRWSSDQSIVEV